MAKLNVPKKVYTHEGAIASQTNPEEMLRRSVMACLLWENSFYESGESIADRISNLIQKVKPEIVRDIAIEARNKMKLRHIPLLIAREMCRYPDHNKYVKEVLFEIIQRPDELTEFLAIYWKDGKQPICNQAKNGLAKAFTKFDEYQLAKWNKDGSIKLRDVLFLVHAKPKDEDQQKLWKRLVDNELKTPDTWEVALSGKNEISKKEKWERLLKENKLGGMALLRNLRNMINETVDLDLVRNALENIRSNRILPFRFISAAKYAPNIEESIEKAMLKCLEEKPKLEGKTILLVDVSGSMDWDNISNKSDITRLEAACGLSILAREICDDIQILTFSQQIALVPNRRGFALKDAIVNSQSHGGTYLSQAIMTINENIKADRIIIITDEQSHDGSINSKFDKSYIINVASYENGVGYGQYTHISGWSESILDYILEIERFGR